ncbi:MAG: lysophospholipid acyltransferase family protein [Candidatus Paceibacterota bacterium]|jgi:1-acyl-sn-glycerol-3-phosphate acyltransferase
MSPEIDIATEQADFKAIQSNKRRKTLIHYYAKCSQLIAGPFLWPIFHLLYRAEIKGKENLKEIKSPIIVIANHIRFFDSFFFRFVLSGYPRLLPLRFMAVRKFLSGHLNLLNTIGIIPLVYGLFAVFLIKKGDEKEPGKNLEKAQNILDQGDNVMIYPEGKIMDGTKIGQFRRGTAVLAQTNYVPVLPVSFRIIKNGSIRKHLYINIGKQITLPETSSVEENTALLQKEVERLFDIV